MKNKIEYTIEFPDGKNFTGKADKNTRGLILLDDACDFIKISEKDLFGLIFDIDGVKFWLKSDKPLSKQAKGNHLLLAFVVKYYVPQPSAIKDEMARYYLYLQLRTDILMNRLPCSFVSLALLGSYAVQSQIGDYQEEVYGTEGVNYIRPIQICLNPTNEMLEKIMELHKTHCGMLPAEAEAKFMENARHLSLYGVHMHHVRDEHGIEMMIGVCSSGILVYLDKLRVNRYVWAKIITLSRQGNQFVIHLRPSQFEDKKLKVIYRLDNSKGAKQLFTLAVDHHLFFRLKEAYSTSDSPFRLLTLNRTSIRSFDDTPTQQRVPSKTRIMESLPPSLTAVTSQKLKSTERAEESLLLEGCAPHSTVDVAKVRSSVRSRFSAANDSDGRAYQSRTFPQDMQDRETFDDAWNGTRGGGYGPWNDATGAGYEHWNDVIGAGYEHWNDAAGAGYDPWNDATGAGYEPWNDVASAGYEHRQNYLRKDVRPVDVAHAPAHHGEPCNYDSGKNPYNSQLRAGVSYCQHRDITQHESPKMIFQDQCHHKCSCDQILEAEGHIEGHTDDFKESKRVYIDDDGNEVTEFKVQSGGVIETYIERRSRVPYNCNDEMLSEAIRNATGVNNDLRVDKIQIEANVPEY